VKPPFPPDLGIGPLPRGPDAEPFVVGLVLGGDIGPCHEPDTVNQARASLVSGHYLTPTATIISQGPSKPDGPSK
jgi:hypothetical protein